MLNSSLIKSLCQISALVYKPNSFFAENYFKKPLPKGCECLSHLNKQPQFIESDIDCQVYVSVFNKNPNLCISPLGPLLVLFHNCGEFALLNFLICFGVRLATGLNTLFLNIWIFFIKVVIFLFL